MKIVRTRQRDRYAPIELKISLTPDCMIVDGTTESSSIPERKKKKWKKDKEKNTRGIITLKEKLSLTHPWGARIIFRQLEFSGRE